jgi:hypothetical protein
MPVYAVAAVLEDGWWNSAQGRTDFQLHMAQVEAALRPYLQRGGVLTVEGGRDSSAGMVYLHFKVAVEEESPVHPSRPALKARF